MQIHCLYLLCNILINAIMRQMTKIYLFNTNNNILSILEIKKCLLLHIDIFSVFPIRVRITILLPLSLM